RVKTLTEEKKIPVILDGDPGHDDAIAWTIAHSSGRFRILSLTPEAFLYLRTPEDGEGDPVLVAASRQGTLRVSLPMAAQNLLTGRAGHRFTAGENSVLYLRLPSALDPDEIRFDSTSG
ncbi:MAG: hypothetical protein IK132_10930, partial [Clostridia bacterium]|nr:hypothetical protein [Clostridia bacterium]